MWFVIKVAMFLFFLLVSMHAQNEIKNSVFVPNIDFSTVVSNLKKYWAAAWKQDVPGKLD